MGVTQYSGVTSRVAKQVYLAPVKRATCTDFVAKAGFVKVIENLESHEIKEFDFLGNSSNLTVPHPPNKFSYG